MVLKLDTIIQNQNEQLTLIRQLASATRGVSGKDVVDDVLPDPLNGSADLTMFTQQLQEKAARDKFVSVLIMSSFFHDKINFPSVGLRFQTRLPPMKSSDRYT